jgi:Phosphotransferase enzyme family
VVAPAAELPQEVHHLAGFEVTFWHYHADDHAVDADPRKLGDALFRVHEALETFSGQLPSF